MCENGSAFDDAVFETVLRPQNENINMDEIGEYYGI